MSRRNQFAIATPLLIVAGLLVVSLHELARVDLGFDTNNVLTGSILAARRTVWGTGTRRSILERAPKPHRSAAWSRAVAFSDGLPPDTVGNFNNFDLEDFPARPGESQPVTPWVAVTPSSSSCSG